MLEGYLYELVKAGGSDLHLRADGPPRIRVHGELAPIPGADVLTDEDTRTIAESIIEPQLLKRFRGGEEVDFAYMLDDHRFRVNLYRQRNTVALVFRLVIADPPTIGELGLPAVVSSFAAEQRGLVIVAGPTGAGKTTTLAAMVDHINRTRAAHIVTIEDPIEVVHSDQLGSISQRELGADTPSFASAMRAAVRQDPDVILVGEMRDAATVQAALLAAETGHLVLSTLHTTDASETVLRIVEFFPPHEQRQVRLLLAGVLKGTVCQRLVPRKDGHGRIAATEIMVVTGRVQQWMTDPAAREDVQDIIADGEYYGMHSFDQSILELYKTGQIDLAAALAHASNPHDLGVTIRRTMPASSQGAPEGAPDATSVAEEDVAHESIAALATKLPVPVPTAAAATTPVAPPTPTTGGAARIGFWRRLFGAHEPKTKGPTRR
jgi:twitching motility protein PilT